MADGLSGVSLCLFSILGRDTHLIRIACPSLGREHSIELSR